MLYIPIPATAPGMETQAGTPTLTKKADYAKRWIVGRTFAHLGNYRRLLIRRERHL